MKKIAANKNYRLAKTAEVLGGGSVTREEGKLLEERVNDLMGRVEYLEYPNAGLTTLKNGDLKDLNDTTQEMMKRIVDLERGLVRLLVPDTDTFPTEPQ